MKIDGRLARNIDFDVALNAANFEVHENIRKKTSILKLQTVKMC